MVVPSGDGERHETACSGSFDTAALSIQRWRRSVDIEQTSIGDGKRKMSLERKVPWRNPLKIKQWRNTLKVVIDGNFGGNPISARLTARGAL